MAMAAVVAKSGGGKKRKCGGLGELHEDVLERVLARLPPASYFRLRGVCRRWSDAAASNTFLAACRRVPARDPWFLMLSEEGQGQGRGRGCPAAAVAFDAGEGAWARCCRGAVPAPAGRDGVTMPVAAAGGRVLYRAADTGRLTVANPLTGASRVLPAAPAAVSGSALHAVAMYGDDPYRVVLISGDLPDLCMAVFDSSRNAWDDAVPLSRNPEPSSPERDVAGVGAAGADETVYFLSKSGDVMATNMQRNAARQYASVVTCRDGGGEGGAVAYFLSNSGAVVACDVARRVFTELPRILPVYFEYSIDVVACGGRAYVVVLSELLGTASLRVWEFAAGDGEWRQVAAMPPSMSHAFYGKKADVNCVGHGDRVMVCVSSGQASGFFMCHVASNRWEELPPCAIAGGDGDAMDFVAPFSFEPRMEVAV